MILTGTYTDAGQALATQFLTGGTLTLTRIVAGSGTTQRDAARMAREEQDLGLCAPTLEDHTALLRCTLNSTQASAPYSLTELGVYASDGEKEVLYLLYTLDQPFPVDPAARVVLRFNLEQTLADGAQVTITAPLSGLVTQEDLDKKADLVDGQVPYAQTPHLTASKTIYVDGSAGSDANHGTQEAPFATIQAAVDALPKDLNGRTATIHIAAGTYGPVSLSGLCGGRVELIGVDGDASQVTIPSLFAAGCTSAAFSWCTFARNDTETVMHVHECMDFQLQRCLVQSSNGIGVNLYYGTRARFYDVRFTGCSSAISVDRNSTLMANYCRGSGNTTGLFMSASGENPTFAILNSCTFGASTEIQKQAGSIVFKDGELV